MNNFKVAVLISGNGSNLQAMIDSFKNQDQIQICSVISNVEDAYGITRASGAGIETHVINHKDYPSRETFEKKLIDKLNDTCPDLIVLAGFMRILSEVFIAEYYGKIINIHPSLLPKYKGMNTHERVLENNEEFHGVTVHYVDDSLDGGPICAQSKLKINTSNVNELENQIHELEYKLYPEVIKQIAEGKMNLIDGKVSKG
jgi:phosphoribosylglycinamide formyltransferase-1